VRPAPISLSVARGVVVVTVGALIVGLAWLSRADDLAAERARRCGEVAGGEPPVSLRATDAAALVLEHVALRRRLCHLGDVDPGPARCDTATACLGVIRSPYHWSRCLLALDEMTCGDVARWWVDRDCGLALVVVADVEAYP
jgi:hypothetical protein